MALVKINWKPNARELRIFGLVMLVGFGIIGAWFYFGFRPLEEAKTDLGLACWIFAAVSGLLGLTGTRAALPVYWLWMAVALVLGTILSYLLLAVVFYGLFTSMGLVMRLMGRDKLKLKPQATESFWQDMEQPEPDPSRYERQF